VTGAGAGWEDPGMRITRTVVLGLCLATVPAAAGAASPAPATASGPPAAWVTTAPGSRPDLPGLGAEQRLLLASSCWRADAGPAVCGDSPLWVGGVPRVVAPRGARMAFRLGFAPTAVVTLRADIRRVRRDGRVRTVWGRVYRLGASEVVTWRVRGRGGRAVLSATAPQGTVTHLLDVVVRP
jgi:hypothetical protein